MSEDLRKLQEAMEAVRGHLQDLQVEQRATTKDLKTLANGFKSLQARSVHIEASMSALGGTFASIEQIITKVAADHEYLEELRSRFDDIVHRVEALEKKAS